MGMMINLLVLGGAGNVKTYRRTNAGIPSEWR